MQSEYSCRVMRMKRKTIDEILKKVGIPVAPDSDPVYSEPYSITFSSRSPAPSQPADSGVDQVSAGELHTEHCPFCGADSCLHHVASLDLTFREIVGGALFEACSIYLARRAEELATDGED